MSQNDKMDPQAREYHNLNRISHFDFQRKQKIASKEKLLVGQSTLTVRCEKHRNTDPQLQKNFIAFACDHCIQQDEVHPVGMVAMKGRVYLCKDCYKRLDNKRGFNGQKDLRTKCWGCIMEEAGRIKAKNPELLLDLTK